MFKRNVFTTNGLVQLGKHIQKIQNLDAALSNTIILTFCLVYKKNKILYWWQWRPQSLFKNHFSIKRVRPLIKSSLFSYRNNLRIFQTEVKVNISIFWHIFPLGLTLESAFNVKAKGTLTRATILLYHSSMRPASIFEHSTNIKAKVTLPISMINKRVILYLRVASIQKLVSNPIFYSLYLRVVCKLELPLFAGVRYSTLIKIAYNVSEKFNIYGYVLNLWTRL